MYRLLRALLFSLPAEFAHRLSLSSLKILLILKKNKYQPPEHSPKQVMGLEFKNPIGLAAGLDKNGDYIDALGSLGFGFIEIGTVTPKPQAGNPRPRLFRLRRSSGIINRMGFNNRGVDYLVENVKKRKYQGVLGINIGKNKSTKLEDALDDYEYCISKIFPYADYIVINVSSPNTPGLRGLQHGKMLDDLLEGIKKVQQSLSEEHKRYVPIAYKIAPDLLEEEVVSICEQLNKASIDGLIATNTTVSRKGIEGSRYVDEAGGLSGEPIFGKSTETQKLFRELLDESIPIIGVGGVFSPEDAKTKFVAGASLVQLYTGLIYLGPSLLKRILAEL